MSEHKEKYNLPEGWIWTTIGEIAILSSGGTPDRGNRSYFNGNIPWVKSGELKYNIIKETEERITIKGLDNSSAKILPVGTLLIALYGATVGRLAFLGTEASTNQAVASIITTESFNKYYLYYYLIRSRDRLLQKRSGGAQPNISQKILHDFILPLPSLSEQNRIVEKLEELLSSLDKSREQLENCKRQINVYRNTVLNVIFNPLKKKTNSYWQYFLLEEVCEKITDGSHFSPKSQSEGYSYITVKDLNSDLIDFSKSAKISKDDYEKLVKSGCQPLMGDVLFSKDGTVGKTALVNYEKEFVVLSSLAILRPDKNIINSKLLFYVLKSPYFLNQALSQKKGVAIRRVILKDLKQIQLFIPLDINEQVAIVNKLDVIFSYCDELENNIVNQLFQVDSLRLSLLKNAFEGKLTDRNYDDKSSRLLLEKIKLEKETYLSLTKEQKITLQKIKIMPEELKSILEVLHEKNTTISAKQLWQLSDKKNDIDAFYAELKKLIERGEIIEMPRVGKESFLKLSE